MKVIYKLSLGILFLIVLSPIGLILPEHFKAGSAWGEWGTEEIKELVGYVPKGLEKFASIWSAPFPDYSFSGWEDKGLGFLSIAYIFSAIVGIIITLLVVVAFGKVLVRGKE